MSPLDLDRLKGLVEIMAAERTKERPELFDDAVQEGLIAAWRVSESHPDEKPAYYRAAARNAILGVVAGRSMTGAESRQGRKDAHDLSTPIIGTSKDGVEYLIVEPACPFSERDFGTAEIAEDLADAIGSLSALDAAIVHGRYWFDLGFADLAEVLGRPAGTLSRRWTEIIRPALREALGEVAA